MTAALTGKPTKAASIALSLTEGIASGRFAPGMALDETAIAAQFGVSRTPIREAIRQLTATGLLETRAHHGAVVRRLSEQELDDTFAVMADLEGLCARGAALAMTAAELDALNGIMEASTACAEAADRDGYAALNLRFHDAIYQGAHNPYLMQLTLQTRARLEPYRRVQFDAPGRLARSQAEHDAVVQAIRARDAAGAFDTMRAHIVVVRESLDRVAPPV